MWLSESLSHREEFQRGTNQDTFRVQKVSRRGLGSFAGLLCCSCWVKMPCKKTWAATSGNGRTFRWDVRCVQLRCCLVWTWLIVGLQPHLAVRFWFAADWWSACVTQPAQLLLSIPTHPPCSPLACLLGACGGTRQRSLHPLRFVGCRTCVISVWDL